MAKELKTYTIHCKPDDPKHPGMHDVYRMTSDKNTLKDVVKEAQVGNMFVFNDGPIEKALPIQEITSIEQGWN